MSDLAPFVAAYLRDRVVHALLEENRLLREQLKKERDNSVKVQVKKSGDSFPDNTTIYYESLLTNGYEENSNDRWVLDFESQRDAKSDKIKIPWHIFAGHLQISVGDFELKLDDSVENALRYLFDEGPTFSFTFSEGEPVVGITGEWDQKAGGNANPFFHDGREHKDPDVIIHKVFLNQFYLKNLLFKHVSGYKDYLVRF